MENKKRKLRQFFLLFLIGTGILLVCAPVRADQIRDASVFADAVWNFKTDWVPDGKRDVLQSMCVTDKYIVCYHDSKKKGVADTLTILDKNTYGHLFDVEDTDYEHGNGMTYNSATNEIIIAPYTCKVAANKGKLFVLDADTFELKRQVQVSDGSWDPSAVEYINGSDSYVIQSNASDNFTFYLYDGNFQYVDTLFRGDTSLQNRFQDFCVSGDFIISVPYQRGAEKSYVQLYSISQKAYCGAFYVGLSGALGRQEAESIAISDSGEIILAAILTNPRRMALYNTYVPIIYTVTTSVENGKITPTRGDVEIGRDYRVKYSCTEDYELKQLQVDGQDVDVKKHPHSYVFGNIQADHSIWARFTEIPKFDILTSVVNGTIDKSQLIRRDEAVTIHYEPDLHYEMDALYIDGEEINPLGYETKYTFTFIQGPHSVDVRFKEIPSFTVSTKVYHGTITATNRKVYRDENYTVKYSPDESYRMAYMRIDDEWLTEIAQDSMAYSHTFVDIQKGHDVEVVYQWMYLPYAILAGAFAACMPMGLIYVLVQRRRRKRNRSSN